MQTPLGRKLRLLRAERGLTLAEASAATGVGPDTLSNLERDRQRAVTPTLAKIAKGYGVPVEDLLEEPGVSLAGSSPKADPLSGAGEYTESRALASLLYSLGSETAHLANPKLAEEVEEAPIPQLFNLLDELDEEIELLTPEITRLYREVRQAVKRGDPGSLDPDFVQSARIRSEVLSEAWSEAAENFLDLKMAYRSRLAVEPEVEVRERIEAAIELVP